MVRVLAVSPDLEPLLHEGVGDEVLAEERGSRIRPHLPCVLAEQILRCRREDERRACADREPTAEERTRQRKCENGVAEPDGPFILAALIEMGNGIGDGHHRADNQPLLLGQPETHQRLEHQIALHPSVIVAAGHLRPIVVLLQLHQPTRGEGINRLLGLCGGRLILTS